MRNWKNWLFPILTCLTVAALALLPLRLSTLRDGELTGTVHAEPLSEDSNFPFKPPELPGRIWLLVQSEEMPDNLTIMAQELEGAERDREFQRLRAALASLEGILPPEMVRMLLELDGDSWNCGRYYLRDQSDLSSASFSITSTYDKRKHISFAATLDVESGQIVGLQVSGADGFEYGSSPLEMGRALLDHLGLPCEPADSGDASGAKDRYSWATFRLEECKSWLQIRVTDFSLCFDFDIYWELVDAALSEAYGYPTDANSIQIW